MALSPLITDSTQLLRLPLSRTAPLMGVANLSLIQFVTIGAEDKWNSTFESDKQGVLESSGVLAALPSLWFFVNVYIQICGCLKRTLTIHSCGNNATKPTRVAICSLLLKTVGAPHSLVADAGVH